MEVEVTDVNFDKEVLQSNLPVLVDFWAEWCAPCRIVAPVIKEIAKCHEGKIKVCKLNIDESPDSTSRYGIRGIPTLVIFKNGELVDKIIGAFPKNELEEKIVSIFQKVI